MPRFRFAAAKGPYGRRGHRRARRNRPVGPPPEPALRGPRQGTRLGPPPSPRWAPMKRLRPPSARKRPRRSNRTQVRAAKSTDAPKPRRRRASAACPSLAPATTTDRRPRRLTREGLIARHHDDRSCRNGPVANCPRGTTACLTSERAVPKAGSKTWVALLLLILLFMVPAAPVAATPVPTRALITLNWSGYALAGRSFTAVTGTFNVPVPMQSASCLEQTAVWVGVDGVSNSDLLQAGITETGFTLPSNRLRSDWPTPDTPPVDCLGRVEAYAWWEDLPTAAVRVALPVNVGDRVTVAIFKISRGWWVVAVHDLTDKHSFLLAQPYGGPQTSVEWVVEAPQVLGNVGDLVPFRTVHFYGLAAQGMPRGLERFDFLPGSHFESSADAVSNAGQLIRRGFAVHFAD